MVWEGEQRGAYEQAAAQASATRKSRWGRGRCYSTPDFDRLFDPLPAVPAGLGKNRTLARSTASWRRKDAGSPG
jgi:hypothetical protein